MKTIGSILVLASFMSLPALALAQDVQGHWAVAGNVDGKAFTLDCQFKKAEQDLSGACVDGPTGDATVQGGRSHPLTEGHITGESVDWSYQTSYLFIKFDVKYIGILRDDHMSGSIAAAGKTGTFTANRVNP